MYILQDKLLFSHFMLGDIYVNGIRINLVNCKVILEKI